MSDFSKFCEKKFRNFSKFLFTSTATSLINFNNQLNKFNNIVLLDNGINHALFINDSGSFTVKYG